MTTQIGAQMYTIRDHLKTPADIAKSCKKLADIGYKAVQTSALGPIEASELKKILDDHGLVCAATHQSPAELAETQKCLDYHQTLGCELTAIGGFFQTQDNSRKVWEDFIQSFNPLVKPLGEKGLKVGYHNHSHELAPLDNQPGPGAVTPLQLLLDQLDAHAWFEIDTYWITHGGGDPAAWIEKVKGRLPAVHFKDMTITNQREQKMCEVGSGNLNWPRIIDACKAAGVRWFLVERDRGDLDPFESLKISLENLKAMGLS